MTTINSLLSTLVNDLKGLEQAVSQLNSGNSPSLSNFADALANAETAAQQALSANSAVSTGSGTGPNSNLLDSTTLASLLNSSSNSGQVAGTAQLQPASANSTASTGSGTGPNSNLLDSTTSVSLLNSSSNSGQAAGTAHLLPAGATPDGIHKPSMAQFMAATGCSSDTAGDVLYGSIGSNTDLRDWQAIMASSDPLGDARTSTSAMYNSGIDYASPDATKPNGDVVAQAGNFAYVNLKTPKPWDPQQTTPTLLMLDNQGNQLTTIANPQELTTRGTNFGFDMTALSLLQSKLDAKQVPFRANGWYRGFLST